MKNIQLNDTGLSDNTIIEKILAGNSHLFEILVRRYNPVLYRIARSYGFNHQDAEDLMQEAHITAYFKLAQLEQRSYYKNWIATILSHKCLYKKSYGYFSRELPNSDLVSHEIQPLHYTARENDGVNKILNRELGSILESSVQSLPTTYRTVLILREVEGFSIKETAELLHITTANVKIRLNRAKSLMQRKLRKLYTSEVFEFNLIYCDAIVKKVLDQISSEKMHALNN